MKDNRKKDMHSFVKLLKNHIYATYQLHAYMRNTKISPEKGIVIGALTVCEWLRNRLGEDIPEELNLPMPSEYENVTVDMFKSLHINRGFVIDIISLPEEHVWSLQIVEPDLGSDPGNPYQSRLPVAGRILETNVGFCIRNNRLECGVKTVISDPENSPLAEVYRPAFVKQLYKNPDFGLQHITPIDQSVSYINNLEQLKGLLSVYKNEENQLPILVFTKIRKVKEEEKLPLDSLSMEQLANRKIADEIDENGHLITKIEVENTCTKVAANKLAKKSGKKGEKLIASSLEELRILSKNPFLTHSHPILKKVEYEYLKPTYNVYALAARVTGFARVYVLNENLMNRFNESLGLNVSYGDVVFLEPQCFGAEISVYSLNGANSTEQYFNRMIFHYPRGKNFDFHNIHFLSGARDALIQSKQRIEELSEENLTEWQIALRSAEEKSKAALQERERKIAELESKLNRQKQQTQIEENKNKALRVEQERLKEEHKIELAKKDEWIAFLDRQAKRPHTKKELPGWVEKEHKNHLILHPKAIQTFDSAHVNSEQLEIIYDALDFMATDYWENRYAGLSEKEMRGRASKKYDRNFKLEPCMSTSIDVFPEQYKIPYFKDEMGNIRPSDLNYHFKVGVKSEHMVRIYFLFDDKNKLIVVGSMPDHLRTVSF